MLLEDFFKRIEQQYEEQLPFVVYRKPHKTEVKALLQTSNRLVYTSEFKEKGFIFSPFDNREATILMPLEASEELLLKAYDFKEEEPSTLEDVEDPFVKTQHLDLVSRGIQAIEKGVFKKVVLSRKEEIAKQKQNPLTIFKRILAKYPSAFVYCWYHPKVGLWLGATPETLVKIEGSRFSIMALAGTQVYNDTLDVNWGEKEIQEQQYVTDFVVDSLKPSVNNIKVSDRTTVKAGNLLHLKTMISAQLKPSANLKEVLYSIHPTPAVCGLPKLEAKAFILKEESYKRTYYTGFLGELNIESSATPRTGRRNIENRAYAINRESTQLYVNLRCMQLNEKGAIIYVGGGITQSSNAQKEWEETKAKALVMKSVL